MAEKSDVMLPKKDFKDLPVRLQCFVEYFVERIETKLIFLHCLLEGKAENAGKHIKMYTNAAGKLAKASVMGILSHFLGPVGKPVTKLAGMGAEKLMKYSLEYISEKIQKKDAIKLSELVYAFYDNKSIGREVFVRIGAEIFYSFEMQFMRVTSDSIGPVKAIKKLAVEAADRILSCDENSEYVTLSAERVCHFTNSIFGIRKPELMGSKIIYEYEEHRRQWNVTRMYEGIGVALLRDGFEDDYDFYTKDGKESVEFGYRRLFHTEDICELNNKYCLTSAPEKSHLQLKHVKNHIYYKQQVERMVKKINSKDKKLNEKRTKESIEDTKKVLLEEIKLMKNKNPACDETNSVLNSVEDRIKDTPVDECFKKMQESLKEINQSIEVGFDTTLKRLDAIEKKIENPHRKSEKEPVKFNLINPVTTFTGREEQLIKLHGALQSNNNMAVISQVATVTGLGGVGKTELSRKYALVYASFYKNIIFINAETRDNTLKCFKTLAKERLNISLIDEKERERDIRLIIDEVYRYFDQDKATLLIFDNVEKYTDIENLLPKFVPNHSKPCVLITSRCRDWNVGEEGDIKVISLDTFTPEEAVEYVITALKLSNLPIDNNETDLTKRLHFLPLALKQAVGYINQQNRITPKKKFTTREYLNLIDDHTNNLLSEGLNKHEGRCNETVLTTWTITLKKISNDKDCGALAKKMFKMMAYLNPDSIDTEVIFSELEADKLKLRSAVNLLENYSMISLVDDDGTVAIHRLVQEVTRLTLIKNKKEETVLRMVLELLNSTDFNQNIVTPWEYACSYPKLVSKFFEKKNRSNETVLHLFARYRNDCSAIKTAFEYIDCTIIDEIDFNSNTPLYIAAGNGNLNVVEYLIKNGANIHATNQQGRTPLHAASFYGHAKVVEFLISKDHDRRTIYALNVFHKSPIEQAADNCQNKVVEILEPRNKQTYLFHTNLYRAFHSDNYQLCIKMIEKSIELNPDAIKSIMLKKRILHLVAQQPCLVELVIKCGIDVNVADSNGNTALHITAQSGWIPSMELLLNNGAEPNLINNWGKTPLHLTSNVDAVEILSNKGAHIESVDSTGESVLYNAVFCGRLNVVKYLIDNGANLSNHKLTLIHVAALSSSIEVLKLVLDTFKERNLSVKDEKGNTPLHYGVYKKCEVVQLLLDWGLSFNEQNHCGETPIYAAVKRFDSGAVNYLIDVGVNLDVPNELGKSPLHEAVEHLSCGLIKSLLSGGANSNLKDCSGKTPLYYATLYKSQEVTKLLLEKGAKCETSHSENATSMISERCSIQ